MAQRSIQSLTEINTSKLSGGKGAAGEKGDNFTVIYEHIVCKIWDPRRLTTL
jgi:hypothetical protein